ncbi:MAG: UDP-N-acetylmuramate dehydrogenase [Actinomycetota bacterium]|jgi:UDP-N-acetylmuramate dehydrogenase|nr:UDP-N-acetylmuramate dehydrogenase [Actinomycetota bacterium]
MKLADLTTLHVGGDAADVLEPRTPDELLIAVRHTWATGDDWLVLGGGSNVVISDDGFDGTVLRVLTRGIESLSHDTAAVRPSAYLGDRTVRLRVQAGEPWDAVVQHAVENGWAGIEALSGIPGSSGAAPIQNIGAYGQELGSSLVAIEFLDYLSGELLRIPAPELGLGYRTSLLKQGRQGLVVSIELELLAGGEGGPALSAPIAYEQLATTLGVRIGDRVPLDELRSTVLALRASKGMLLDPNDRDSYSAGSFFTNPIVSENFARRLPAAAPRWPTSPEERDVAVPLGETAAAPTTSGEYHVKLSAAWLIERAGISRGFALPGSRAAVSSRHTLALVNTGGATADEVVQLARFVQTRVFAEFGVRLQPEPILIGLSL